MIIRLLGAAALLVVIGATPAAAGPLDDCRARSDDAVQAKACLAELLRKRDGELMAVQDKLSAVAAERDAVDRRRAAVQRVDQARQAFKAFRDQSCALEAALQQSKIDPGAWELACAIARTEARAKELERLLAVARGKVAPALVEAAAASAQPEAEAVVAAAAFGDRGALRSTRQRDWSAACFPDGSCEAWVLSSADAAAALEPQTLAVRRAGRAGQWVVALSTSGVYADFARPVAVSIDGAPPYVFTMETGLKEGGHDSELVLDVAALRADMLDTFKAGKSAKISFSTINGSRVSAEFSLMGLTHTIGWIDGSQDG